MKYTFTEQLKIILKRKGISSAKLSEMLGITPPNLTQQMRRDNFREQDMEKICSLLDCELYLEIKEKNTVNP